MTFATFNTTIEIQKKGDSAVDFTAEINNFTETGLGRKVTYTKTVGGRIIPRMENQSSQEVSFDFVLDSGDEIQGLTGSNTWDFDFNTYNNNLIRLALDFESGSNYYTKRYYNCFLTKFKVEPKSEVLQGKLSFSFPMKDMNGYSNVYSGSDINDADTYDTTLGY